MAVYTRNTSQKWMPFHGLSGLNDEYCNNTVEVFSLGMFPLHHLEERRVITVTTDIIYKMLRS